MKFHRLKLYYLKRKASIVFFIMAMGMFTTMLVGIYLLLATQQTSSAIRQNQEQNQQLLKSLSCILLILPEDRTETKIQECVKINGIDANNSEFMFKVLDEKSEIKKSSPEIISLLKKEFQGNSGHDGADGEDGADGKDGKNSKSINTTIKETVIEQAPIVKGIKDIRYNVDKQRFEILYDGDDNYQVLVNACELINNCP